MSAALVLAAARALGSGPPKAGEASGGGPNQILWPDRGRRLLIAARGALPQHVVQITLESDQRVALRRERHDLLLEHGGP